MVEFNLPRGVSWTSIARLRKAVIESTDLSHAIRVRLSCRNPLVRF